MLRHMNAEAKAPLASAAASVARENRPSIQSADIALALISSGLFDTLFAAHGPSEVIECLKALPREEPIFRFGMPVDVYVYSDLVKRILAYALEEAERSGEPKLRPRDLLIAILAEKECGSACLFRFHGLDVGRVRAIG